jgi:hypothetical protein
MMSAQGLNCPMRYAGVDAHADLFDGEAKMPRHCRIEATLVAMVVLITAASASSKDVIPFNSVKHWIKWYHSGDSFDLPPRIIYLTAQRFKVEDDRLDALRYSVLVLSPPQYEIVARFTQTNGCDSGPAGTPGYTVHLDKHDDGHTRGCEMLQGPGCRYFFGLLKLQDIHWTDEALMQIRGSMEEIKCPNTPESK